MFYILLFTLSLGNSVRISHSLQTGLVSRAQGPCWLLAAALGTAHGWWKEVNSADEAWRKGGRECSRFGHVGRHLDNPRYSDVGLGCQHTLAKL